MNEQFGVVARPGLEDAVGKLQCEVGKTDARLVWCYIGGSVIDRRYGRVVLLTVVDENLRIVLHQLEERGSESSEAATRLIT